MFLYLRGEMVYTFYIIDVDSQLIFYMLFTWMEIFLNGLVCPNDWRDIQTSNHLFSNAFERQRRSKTNDLMFAKVEIQNFQNVNKRKFRLLIWNIVTLYFIVVSFLEIRDLCVVVMAWFSILYIEYRGTEVHGSVFFSSFCM